MSEILNFFHLCNCRKKVSKKMSLGKLLELKKMNYENECEHHLQGIPVRSHQEAVLLYCGTRLDHVLECERASPTWQNL